MDFHRLSQFREFVDYCESNFSGCEITLEEYLINLLFLVRENRESQVTERLILSILEGAFEPQEDYRFESEWLIYTGPANIPFDEVKWVQIEVQSPQDYEYLEHTLLFQIAELHRMKEDGILDKPDHELYGGIDSPSGHRWYNFSPIPYLSVVASCFSSCGSYQSEEACEIDWLDLESILETGRTWE